MRLGRLSLRMRRLSLDVVALLRLVSVLRLDWLVERSLARRRRPLLLGVRLVEGLLRNWDRRVHVRARRRGRDRRRVLRSIRLLRRHVLRVAVRVLLGRRVLLLRVVLLRVLALLLLLSSVRLLPVQNLPIQRHSLRQLRLHLRQHLWKS